MYDFMYTSSKKQGVASKFATSRGILHIKIGGIKTKKLQNLGVQLITSNPRLSLPFRIQSWERFKNRGVQKVSDRNQQVLMVDLCLTPRVIILTTQRNPKMITFMGEIQEGYGYIYSATFPKDSLLIL